MKQVARKILKKYSDRLLKSTNSKLDEIYQEVAHIKADINHLNFSMTEEKPRLIPISERLIIVKMFSGLKICLDPSDVAVVPHLALDGIWESAMTKAWQKVLKPDQVVLDIGANFGYYGLLAAQRFPEASKEKVIFFEANPHLIPYINKTLSINGLHRLSSVENFAVSDKSGQATLTVLKDFVGSSSLHTLDHLKTYLGDKMPLEASEEITIQAITLDNYCNEKNIQKVNLIKLDIEGFEEKAYLGMRQLVKNNDDLVIFLEFTAKSYDNPQQFYKRLLQDFRYLYLINEIGEIYAPQHNDYSQTIGQTDDFIMLVLSKQRLEGVLEKVK